MYLSPSLKAEVTGFSGLALLGIRSESVTVARMH